MGFEEEVSRELDSMHNKIGLLEEWEVWITEMAKYLHSSAPHLSEQETMSYVRVAALWYQIFSEITATSPGFYDTPAELAYVLDDARTIAFDRVESTPRDHEGKPTFRAYLYSFDVFLRTVGEERATAFTKIIEPFPKNKTN